MPDCPACGLGDGPQVPGDGPERTRFAIVGEAPGAEEVRQGKPFVGRSGRLLLAVLEQVGLGREDVYLTNACKCRPTQGKTTPTLGQARTCAVTLKEELESRGVERLLVLGATALRALTGATGITAARGRPRQLPQLDVIGLPAFHPAAVLRNVDYFPAFAQDVQRFAQAVELTVDSPEWSFKVVDNVLEAVNLVSNLNGPVVLDIETSGYSMVDDDVLCLVLAWGPDSVHVLTQRVLYSPPVLHALHRVCDAGQVEWTGHNLAFDVRMLEAHLGFRPEIGFDTMLAHYALDERTKPIGTHDLKRICADIFDAPDWEGDIKRYLAKPKTDSYAMLPTDVLHRYSAHDGYYTWRLREHLWEELRDEPNLRQLLSGLLIPGSEALANMTRDGICIDTNALDALYAEAVETQTRTKQALRDLVGDSTYNPNSSHQTKRWLYDHLGAPLYTESQIPGFVPKLAAPTSRQKPDTTAIAQLERLAFSQRGELQQFCKLLIAYKQAVTLTSRYLPNWEPLEDGRIHPGYLLHGTVTGRLASAGPNVMNPPHERGVRELIVAPRGRTLLACDYGQNELRVLAVLSGDKNMIETFQRGADVHDETARAIWGDNYTGHDRMIAKSINFGAAYGRTAKSIADGFGLSYQDAVEYVRIFTRRFPEVDEWRQTQYELVETQGYVESPTGRRRRFPLVVDSNVREVMRQCVNSPVQGTGSDLMLLSIIAIDKFIHDYGGHILLPMHDSLMLEVPLEHLEEVAWRVRRTMLATPLQVFGKDCPVPWVVEIKAGRRWAEAEMEELEWPPSLRRDWLRRF